MLTQIDIKKSPSFRWGLEEGLEIGKARGLELGEARGIAIGETKGKESIVLQLFPIMDDQTIAKISGLSIETIQSLRNAQ